MGKEQARKIVEEAITKDKVVVFSKTYCPYCKMAKGSLDKVGAKYVVIELDNRNDGGAIQDALAEITGARTVPRVFISGKCIGGGSETQNLEKSGQLATMVA
ncbi:uncharacterized protein [Clytia hemisphaerica]|uniref:Glutaredoxin-2, mitochondrial n=1 Tax=Clytia hemisphaerica TaxID=252671 RepID=A0A7M6DNY3_9CNID